jgi:hypothetical protein
MSMSRWPIAVALAAACALRPGSVQAQSVEAALVEAQSVEGLSVEGQSMQGQSHTLSGPAVSASGDGGTDMLGAIGDSIKLLFIEHGTRVAFQEKTRSELAGPFWSDYKRSVRWPGQWEDGDSWWVNYIGHPIHGAAAGLIWLDHSKDEPLRLSLDTRYWASRGRSAAFIAAYSFQFEIGPLSEASIGNVGLRPETTGWVDYVVTPVGGFGLLVAEDALDRYFVEWFERHVGNRFARATIRMLFGPSRTLANLSESRPPWERPGRPLLGR